MDKTFKPALLPYFFKKIGFAYLILIGLLFLCEKTFSIRIWEYISLQKEIFKTYSEYMFLLALYFVAMSKEKKEDEMAGFIRLNIMSKTYGYLIYLFLLFLFTNIYGGTPTPKFSYDKIIAMMLIMYLAIFYWYKWKTLWENRKNQKIEA